MRSLLAGELTAQDITRAATLYRLFAEHGIEPTVVLWAIMMSQEEKKVGGDFFASMARHLGVERSLLDEIYASLRDW